MCNCLKMHWARILSTIAKVLSAWNRESHSFARSRFLELFKIQFWCSHWQDARRAQRVTRMWKLVVSTWVIVDHLHQLHQKRRQRNWQRKPKWSWSHFTGFLNTECFKAPENIVLNEGINRLLLENEAFTKQLKSNFGKKYYLLKAQYSKTWLICIIGFDWERPGNKQSDKCHHVWIQMFAKHDWCNGKIQKFVLWVTKMNQTLAENVVFM